MAAIQASIVYGSDLVDHQVGIDCKSRATRRNAHPKWIGLGQIGGGRNDHRRGMAVLIEQIRLQHQNGASFARFCSSLGVKVS